MPPKKGEGSVAATATTKSTIENDVCNERVILNEVIMYTNEHRHSSTKENLVKVLSCRFALEEVVKAKDRLIIECGERISPDRKKNRKDSPNRSEKMKVCEDIIDAFADVDEHGDIELICAAVKWAKIPKVDPESISDLSTAEKLVQLEAKFKVFEFSLSEIKAHQLEMDEKARVNHVITTCNDTEGYIKNPLFTEIIARGCEVNHKSTHHGMNGGVPSEGTSNVPQYKNANPMQAGKASDLHALSTTTRNSKENENVQKTTEHQTSKSGKAFNSRGDEFQFTTEQRKRQVR